MKIRDLGFLNLLYSFYINIKLFPLSQAIKLPIFAPRTTKFKGLQKGSIVFTSKLRSGLLNFGLVSNNEYFGSQMPLSSYIYITGKLIVHGEGSHYFMKGCYMNIYGTLEIGNNFYVGHNIRWTIAKHCIIGDQNMYSYFNFLMDTDGHPIFDENNTIINPSKAFKIGDNVWIGCRCTILKGAEIPTGSIIASGSIVTKSLESPQSIYLSNKKIKERILWNSNLHL